MRLGTEYPYLLAAWSVAGMYLAAIAGMQLRKQGSFKREFASDLSVLLSASLTLLGLIIGFSFSMAVARYDTRKTTEENEANAIGTEYLRVELMPSVEAATAQALLRRYISARIAFYELENPSDIEDNERKTAAIQTRMWTVVSEYARARPTPIASSIASGMNDTINTEGYTRAAWLNRIPGAAWVLMIAIAIACNGLFGFQTRPQGTVYWRMLVLPVIVAVAFMLIADLDSPRHGLIRNEPVNLSEVASSMGATH